MELPNIRNLAADGVRFDRHYSVVTPCGPSRVSLLTGQYAMNHRAVRNGTPARADTPNLATELARSGREPLLFGYTDTSPDPRVLPHDDPRFFSYEGLAPGFTEVLKFRLEEGDGEWEAHLAERGIRETGYPQLYKPIGDSIVSPAIYSAEDSDTAFLTDRVLADLATRDPGWSAMVTYIRPHPPFVAPEPFNKAVNPLTIPYPRNAPDTHPAMAATRAKSPISSTVVGFPDLEDSPENTRVLRSIYLGLANEVDIHIGRIIEWLKQIGQYDETLIVVTSDHGEMLGDFGLWGKASFHDAAFHVPLIIRTPSSARGYVVQEFTESIDIAPTILDLLGVSVPHSMNGSVLTPFLSGETPEEWRTYSFSELDLGNPLRPTEWQKQMGLKLNEANLAVLRTDQYRWIQFAGDVPTVLFDMENDGEMRNLAQEPTYFPIAIDLSRQMLCHRMKHPDGTFSRTLVTSEGLKVAPL